MNNISTKKATLLLILIALLCKILGFSRELLLAKFFGTSSIVDIYLISISIPSILFGFLPAIGIGVTSLFFHIDKKKRVQFINNVLFISIFISLFCVFITYLGANQIVNFIAHGFSLDAKLLTTSFLKITIWSILFMTPIQILTSYLNCNNGYIYSNVSNLAISAIQIACIVIAAYINKSYLPFSYIIPLFVQLSLLLFFSFIYSFNLILKINFDINIKKLLLLTCPIFLSNILVDVNSLIDKYLASYLQIGSISALNYAFTLRSVFFTIASTIISSISYPNIAKFFALGNKTEMLSNIRYTINTLIILFLPIEILCIVFSEEIIKIIYMRGNFNLESLILTKYPFIIYSVSLIFIILRDFFIKVLYATGDMKSNSIYSATTIVINILLSVILVKKLAHIGLALSATLAILLTMPLYYKRLIYIIQYNILYQSYHKLYKIFYSIFFMTILALIVKIIFIKFYPLNMQYSVMDILLFILNIIILLSVYFYLLMYFKIEEVEDWMAVLKRRVLAKFHTQ